MTETVPNLPIPISAICDKYLIFDIEAISWLRRTHNICGVFVGTLPQTPQQNVFMGLPMQIMTEEAQLLLDLGIAYILDDAKAHDFAMADTNSENRRRYVNEIDEQVRGIGIEKARQKEVDKKKALKRAKEKAERKTKTESAEDLVEVDADADSLFSSFVPSPSIPSHAGNSVTHQLAMTPTSSALLLGFTIGDFEVGTKHLPNISTSSYNLYRHLHQSRTFYHTPGLRFGSQFSVYPGDPLRFHSHFLAVGLDWEQDIDLMDIVGGGRLGTGVKKGFLLGGKQPSREGMLSHTDNGDGGDEGKMRCFSIEWAAM